MYCFVLCWTFQCSSHFIFCEGTLFESFRPNDPTQFLTSFLWSITQIPAWRLLEQVSMPAKMYVNHKFWWVHFRNVVCYSLVVASCWNFLVGCRLIAGSGSAFHIASSRMPDFCENLQHEHPSEACWVHYGINFVPIHIHACLEGQFVTSSSVTIASCWGCVGHSQSQCCNSVGLFLNRRLPSLFAPKPVTTA